MLIYQKYVDVCPADSAVWQESKCGCDKSDEKYASPFHAVFSKYMATELKNAGSGNPKEYLLQ